MNNYHITKCPNCKQGIVFSEQGEIMLHGYKHLNEVLKRISNKESINKIAKDFCRGCGLKLPCGCGKYSKPQHGQPWC